MIKKYHVSEQYGNTWNPKSYVKFISGTQTYNKFPITLRTTQQSIPTWSVKGNMVQNGVPSSIAPITPSECGERTKNLWDNLGFSADPIKTSGIHMISNNYGTSLSTVSGGSVDITQVASGSTIAYQNGFFFIEIDISQFSIGDDFVISFDYEITKKAGSTSTTVSYVGQGTTSTKVIADWSNSGRAIIKATVTSAMTKPYVEIRLCGNSIKVRNVQINRGSTALPYQPYGYKLDIKSGNTTTPMYLGEIQTTRKIKKLVLTGRETWQEYQGTNAMRYNLPPIISDGVPLSTLICSHLSFGGYTATDGYAGEITETNSTTLFRIYFWSDINTLTAWKAYLAQQYAAGTPVTVWYVLANETTGIVNEPLRKIGDYADSITNPVSLPTVPGLNTIDVNTTLKPSEMSLTYDGYKVCKSTKIQQ